MSERDIAAYLARAKESLDGAVSEYANGRYNNCANRAYYACFQAAIAALMREGITPPNRDNRWGHEFVQARFVGDLINRRKRYPVALRETLVQGLRLRHTADYTTERVAAIQASRAVNRARTFVDAVTETGATDQ
jgi:uncharacterized protein (UPF0332 family)